jgi:hypothetical protein
MRYVNDTPSSPRPTSAGGGGAPPFRENIPQVARVKTAERPGAVNFGWSSLMLLKLLLLLMIIRVVVVVIGGSDSVEIVLAMLLVVDDVSCVVIQHSLIFSRFWL